MRTNKVLLPALLLAALPLAARAGDMSYSFIDAGWVNFNPDRFGSSDGASLRGSFAFSQSFFGFAELSEFPRGSSSNLDLYAVGIGARYATSDRANLVGRVGVARAETGTLHDNGVLASFGVRGQPVDRLEAELHLVYTDFGDTDSGDVELAVAARFFFTDRFALGAEYRDGDDAKTAFVGVRFAF